MDSLNKLAEKVEKEHKENVIRCKICGGDTTQGLIIDDAVWWLCPHHLKKELEVS